MVLGVDEYWDKEEAHKHTNYNIFKKFTQRILKETGFEYRNWIENESKKNYKQHIGTRNRTSLSSMGITDVYIFGHSLDITDKDVLRDLILNNNVYTTIFYFNKDDFGTKIANLVKVIGQDELIKRTGGNTKTIEFELQKDMVDR